MYIRNQASNAHYAVGYYHDICMQMNKYCEDTAVYGMSG